MKKFFFSIILLCMLCSSAQANENYISKKSPYSVAKSIDRLEKVLESKEIAIFARIDHGAGARKVGKLLHLNQLLIFGNPKLGSPLIKEAHMMGLELPMKILAWEDNRDQVWISYLKPTVLQQRYDLNNQSIIKKMADALDAITNKTIEKD